MKRNSLGPHRAIILPCLYPTAYTYCLWCLLEIYVFLEMGGDVSNIDVRLLRSPASQQNDAEVADQLLFQFDARNARRAPQGNRQGNLIGL